jgi:hypothetical protein
MRLKLITSLCWMLILTACSNRQVATNAGKYKPIINTHPRYFVSVSGHIDPQIAKAVHLIWQTTAWTKNPKCNVTYNQFEGVVGWRSHVTHYTVKPDSKGSYFIRIPIDRYLPGYCDWRMRSISFSLQGNWLGQVLIANFSKKHRKLQDRLARSDIGCCWDKEHRFNCKFFGNFEAYGHSTYDVNPYQNYQYQLNIYQQED